MNEIAVPITKFYQGKAHSIFKEVAENGVMVVTKNKIPVCVLVSPSRYDAIVEALEDFELYSIAAERLAKANPKDYITQEEIMKELGFTEDDLNNFDGDIL